MTTITKTEPNAADQKGDEKAEVTTEESLMKALADLEGRKPEQDEKSTVQPIQLTGEAMKTVNELLSDRLKKSMTSNTDLTEIVKLMCAHIDRNLGMLEKSVNAALVRDEAYLRMFKKTTEKLGLMETSLAKAMNTAVPNDTSPQAGDTVVTKGNDDGEQKKDPVALKQSIVDGLNTLIRKSTANSPEGERLIQVLVGFESGIGIGDADLKKALAASREG